MERYYKAELAWRDAHIEHGAAEKVALEMKAEAKDTNSSSWSARMPGCVA